MQSKTSERFLALDVFRGMTICLMIIVNTPGNGDTSFAPLKHAHWNGFTPTDLVFPSFMFAVGNAMSFVMRRWSEMQTGQVLAKIFKRTLIIFLLGYLMYWFPFFEYNDQHHLVLSPIADTRIFGVLQRIALGYCFASLMLYFFGTRATVIITAIILILYWPVMVYFGTGTDPLDVHTNAVLRLDTWLIGTKHLYTGEGFPFDPEGFLSTFPAIGNVVGGYLAGKYIQKNGKTFEGLAKLFMAGFILFVIAFFWNYGFPINKKIWTSSFVLHTVGLDCMILACILYYVDFL
jgi:predicted acyltransferase